MVLVGVAISLVLSDTAHGQVFLISSEKAITEFMAGKEKLKDAIPLVQWAVNLVRLIMAVFLCYSVLGTFHAIQRDEPWTKTISPVLFILVVTFVIDVVVPILVKK